MSFIDDIKSVGSYLTGDSTGAALARTAMLAYAVYKVNKTATPDNSPSAPQADAGQRLQLDPKTTNAIPVVYGSAFLGGSITDAQSTNDNKTMTYCITICEKTGNKLSDGLPSNFVFRDIYCNDQRIVFKSDGITAAYSVDRDSNIDYSIADLVQVYCYAGSSTNQVAPYGYSLGSTANAYSVMPGWTSSHSMSDLIFIIIKVNYNKEKNVTSVPTMRFHIENSMDQPGDCIYDYMTNTRYGAGIDPAEINS
jgi:hypothetical protein